MTPRGLLFHTVLASLSVCLPQIAPCDIARRFQGVFAIIIERVVSAARNAHFNRRGGGSDSDGWKAGRRTPREEPVLGKNRDGIDEQHRDCPTLAFHAPCFLAVSSAGIWRRWEAYCRRNLLRRAFWAMRLGPLAAFLGCRVGNVREGEVGDVALLELSL